MSKMFFSPFGGVSTNDTHELQQWKKQYRGSDYSFWDKKNGPLSPPLRKLGMFDELYVIGHGLPGGQTLTSEPQGRLQETTEKVDFEEVGDRIKASGLPVSFSGAIKVWACHSAEEGSKHEPAFADCLARYMYHALKYRNCKFIGYEGSLSAYKTKEQGDWIKHNYSYDSSGGVKGRASKFRRIFKGNKPRILLGNGRPEETI